jgi:hypothetical protein
MLFSLVSTTPGRDREGSLDQRLERQDAELAELAARFEEIASTLRELGVDTVRIEATDDEKRVLVEE